MAWAFVKSRGDKLVADGCIRSEAWVAFPAFRLKSPHVSMELQIEELIGTRQRKIRFDGIYFKKVSMTHVLK